MSENLSLPYLSGVRNPKGLCKFCGGPCLGTRDYCKLRCRDAAHYARRKEKENQEILAALAAPTVEITSKKTPYMGEEAFGWLCLDLNANPSLSPYWFSGVPEGCSWTPPEGFTFERLANGDAKLEIKL